MFSPWGGPTRGADDGHCHDLCAEPRNDRRRAQRASHWEGVSLMRTLVIGSAAGFAASLVLSGAALAGNATGVVKFAGTAPAPKKIEKTKDVEVCGKIANTAEDLIVGAGGMLKNAVVMVTVPGAKPMPVPAAPAVLDQKGCWFIPHIQIVAPGQEVDVT